jgi:dTDP-4-dehydrorhamnose reductase
MVILLTGVTGQLGFELQRTLASLGKIIGLDRKALDLRDTKAIQKIVREVKPNIIVNPAAYTAVDQAEKEADLAFAINAKAPAVFAEEALALNALLIHYSTDYIFDGKKTHAYTEDDLPNPLNVYGSSKLEGEKAILQSGCRHLIFRSSWVYGMRGKNFLLTMLKLGRERPTLKIVDDQVGTPNWSRMLAEASALALFKTIQNADARMDGVYHLSAGGETSWYGFAQSIFTLANIPVEIQAIASADYPTLATRPKNSRLNPEKFYRVFGLELPPWQDGLKLCLDS